MYHFTILGIYFDTIDVENQPFVDHLPNGTSLVFYHFFGVCYPRVILLT